MLNKILFKNISKLYTVSGGVKIGKELQNNNLLENAYFVVENGIINEVGLMSELKENNYDSIVDLKGKIVTPGFIDSHTHLVFAGNRNDEYIKLLQGKNYMDIYNEGGGIFKTVLLTKKASFDELYLKAQKTVNYMISKGVTTIESKSGYGLELETEIKQLKVVKKLQENFDIDFVSTYLGAHALPKDIDVNDFIDLIINDALPIIKKERLASIVDVFCEKGVFGLQETEKVLKASQEMGFKLKLHADEMNPLGGAKLAAKYSCLSADHLLQASESDLLKMKEKGVVATLLPMTSFNLHKPLANLRFMKENDLIIALASDYNPGSSPCSDFISMMRVACRTYRLLPSEILSMVTINAAKAVGMENIIGSIEINKKADFVVFNSESFDDIIVNFGSTQIDSVYKLGKKQEVVYGD